MSNSDPSPSGRRWPGALLRWGVLVAAALAAALHAPRPVVSLLLPAMSPFLALCGAVAARQVHVALILSVPVLAFALLRGRWFCRTLCPTGHLLDQAARLRPGARLRYRGFPSLGRWLALATLAAAVAGWPLFLWLDPLSIFNAFFGAWGAPALAAAGHPLHQALPVGLAAISGVLLPVLLAISAWRPNLWCQRLCPLGASQDLLREAARALARSRAPRAGAPVDLDRRRVLGLVVGAGAVAGVGARFALPFTTPAPGPIRPPGAVPEPRMSGACARCGNCLRACPEGVLHPAVLEAGALDLWTPVMRFGPSYCSEACHACTEVCPTGAIARMGLEEKRRVRIGFAVVKEDLCLAWAEDRECMVCEEYCPFRAVSTVQRGDVAGPVVDEEACRGCGLCEVVCPTQPVAIVIEARPQRWLDPIAL